VVLAGWLNLVLERMVGLALIGAPFLLLLYRHYVPRICSIVHCTRHYVPRTCTCIVSSSMYSSLCSSSMYSYYSVLRTAHIFVALILFAHIAFALLMYINCVVHALVTMFLVHVLVFVVSCLHLSLRSSYMHSYCLSC
jgi:hypothetical protein